VLLHPRPEAPHARAALGDLLFKLPDPRLLRRELGAEGGHFCIAGSKLIQALVLVRVRVCTDAERARPLLRGRGEEGLRRFLVVVVAVRNEKAVAARKVAL
jgi:hypothetical protein